MNETKFGQILENASRLCGREPSVMDIPTAWKALAAMAINEGLTRIAAEKFPMMQRVEFRRYRPSWEANTIYEVGNEVWYSGHYWRKTTSDEMGEPGVDSDWTELKMTEVAAFINWEQPWENTVIDRAGVDVTRFAYEKDPKYYPHTASIKVVGMTDFGVELEAPAPEGVFCKFVPTFPQIDFMDWDSATTYGTGDIVYAAKDIWQCYNESVTSDPTSSTQTDWQRIRIPSEFATFLTRLVAAEILTEDQGKYLTKGLADAEFERLVERYHEGNGENTMRRGRFI